MVFNVCYVYSNLFLKCMFTLKKHLKRWEIFIYNEGPSQKLPLSKRESTGNIKGSHQMWFKLHHWNQPGHDLGALWSLNPADCWAHHFVWPYCSVVRAWAQLASGHGFKSHLGQFLHRIKKSWLKMWPFSSVYHYNKLTSGIPWYISI